MAANTQSYLNNITEMREKKGGYIKIQLDYALYLDIICIWKN